MLPTPTPGLAVSLSSAFFGFYTHAGFLQGLAEKGLWPEEIAGASAGGLVAGLTGAGLTPEQTMRFLLRSDFRRGFLEWRDCVTIPFRHFFGSGTSGLITGRKALAILKNFLGDKRVEDCHAPRVGLAVTNLARCSAEIKRAGPLAEFIIASCAVPTLLAHQMVEGEAYLDGGIANSSPFSHWGASPSVKRILIHSIGKNLPGHPKKWTVRHAMSQAHQTVSNELFALRAGNARAAGQSVEHIHTVTARPGLLIRDKAAWKCFEAGRKTGLDTAETVKEACASSCLL